MNFGSNKTIVVHCYAKNDSEYFKILDSHFYWLKKYSFIFNRAIFVIAMDDINDDELKNLVIENAYCAFGKEKTKIKVVQNDKRLYEVPTFIEYVLNNEDLDGLVFFCHTKGGNRTNQNTMKWISCMYFYNLNFMDDVTSKLDKQNGVFYGTLVHYTNGNPMLNKNNVMYAGNFFWVDICKFRSLFKSSGIKTEDLMKDRYQIENLPGELQTICELNTLNNVNFYWGEIHTYYGDYEKIVKKLGFENEFWGEYNKMVNNIVN